MDVEFDAPIWEWRGPAPYYWVTVSDEGCEYVRFHAQRASYGWGAIPVTARIGETEWETSLLPKNGGYVLPIKQVVRKAEGIDDGDPVTVALSVAPRDGRQANGTGTTWEPRKPS
jgi:hypothetical protein